MSHSTTISKIESIVSIGLLNSLDGWISMLIEGDLHGFEKELTTSMTDLYDLICSGLLKAASSQCMDDLIQQAKNLGACKFDIRQFTVRIATGTQIKVDSPYLKEATDQWVGSRHLLGEHWKMIGGASPMLYDKVGYCAALCPSYDVAYQTLSKFGTEVSLTSVRDITNRLANKCYEIGEESLLIEKDENLVGQNVIISLDGGRTRTREYTGELNSNDQPLYDTPWCEPKLFVIDVVDKEGRIDRHKLPIYGCRFSDVDVLELLERYLVKLKINKAHRVQLIADGAPWIWNNIRPMLERLNVEPDKIIETLDFYHACQYVHQLVQEMPRQVGKKQKSSYLNQFKNWLRNGNSELIVQQCGKIFKRPNDITKRWISYLEKHQSKTQYAEYNRRNLMCGSGIIESGIRRIINLRFKNASTFWKKEIVEKLY